MINDYVENRDNGLVTLTQNEKRDRINIITKRFNSNDGKETTSLCEEKFIAEIESEIASLTARIEHLQALLSDAQAVNEGVKFETLISQPIIEPK